MHLKCFIVINNQIVVCISVHCTYVSTSKTYVSILIIIAALRLFRHIHKLHETHHLIVGECRCLNEFVSDIVNFAQVLENVVQCLQETHYPLLPTTIVGIFAKTR